MEEIGWALSVKDNFSRQVIRSAVSSRYSQPADRCNQASLNTPAEVTQVSVYGAAVLLKCKQQIGVSVCHGPTHLSCVVVVGLVRLLLVLLHPVADQPRCRR